MERRQLRQVQVVCEIPEKVAVGFEKAACTRGGATGDRSTEGCSIETKGADSVTVWCGEVLHSHVVYNLFARPTAIGPNMVSHTHHFFPRASSKALKQLSVWAVVLLLTQVAINKINLHIEQLRNKMIPAIKKGTTIITMYRKT